MLVPIFGVLGSVLVLGESIGAGTIVGGSQSSPASGSYSLRRETAYSKPIYGLGSLQID